MRKISGQVLSTKLVSLSRAAKLLSRFAAVDNGSTPAISLYLERTAEALNHLVQFHKKPLQNNDVGDEPDRKRVQKLQSDWLKNNPDGGKGNSREEDRENVIRVSETNPRLDDAPALSNEREEKSKEKKKKKKKKRKSESVDSGEKKRSSKKRKSKGPES